MIERLQRALQHVEELSLELQEELAVQIEEMTDPLGDLPELHDLPANDTLPPSVRAALALGGVWSDLQSDDEFAALDRIRHESPPTPPMEEQLSWLDEDNA